MPAPKRPNTTAATAAVVRRGQETMARKLRQGGWVVIEPENLETKQKCRLCGYGYPTQDMTGFVCKECV